MALPTYPGAEPDKTAPPALVVALLEDDPEDAELLRRLLTGSWAGPVEVVRFSLVSELISELKKIGPSLVLCDLSVPDGTGIEIVERVVSAAGSAPVVVLTEKSDTKVPELALKAGAQDYLLKGSVDGESLARALRYAMARSEATQENVRIEQSLGAHNRELDRYAGIMTHHFRAPIRTARLFADRLVATMDRGKESPEVAKALDSSLERLELMTDRLQQLATLRDVALQPELHSLNDIVRSVTDELNDQLVAAGATVACRGDNEIVADRTLIHRVMRELVSNSIQYRHPGRELNVVISGRPNGAESTVTVSDNGVGIEPLYRERVFQLFERLTPVESTGLGFGLAYCAQVIDRHGGSVRVIDPLHGPGATVQFSLPRRSG